MAHSAAHGTPPARSWWKRARSVTPKADDLRLTFVASPEFWEAVEELAGETRTTPGEVVIRAVALLRVSANALLRGKRVVILNDDGSIEQEIAGILPRA